MTNMESLYGSGKFTEIMQSVKLTEIKKISEIPASFCGRAHQKKLRICFLMHLLSFPKNQKSLFL